ncbi:response regulator [Vibrio metschnikovii]|nr:response regulator [Vibrio metschnikovii]
MQQLERILYVEDDPDIREIATIALVDVGGLTVKACDSGEIALQSIEAFVPQMILLDVMMPNMDGPETLQKMIQQGYVNDNVAIVFMTAKVQPDEVNRYKQLGAIEVISKPFDPMTLADQIIMLWTRFHD